MNTDEKFEIWLSNVCARILPANEMVQVRTLARELAEGVSKDFWRNSITSIPIGHMRFDNIFSPQSNYSETDLQSAINNSQGEHRFIAEYIYRRWFGNYFPFYLMRINHYIDNNGEFTKSAFDLITETEPTNIFVSYKRSESSAFAMYVLTRLKQENLNAFVDMSLTPGEDWHAGLEERIKEYDYFILLIGKETLKSDVCVKEIEWAIAEGLKIIPVWHNKFKFTANKWDLEPKTESALAKKQAIQVKEESASGYNAAMAELLNRFGITP